MTERVTGKVFFSGAAKKGESFHGWAGPVVSWPEDAPPQVDFGKWQPDRASPRGAGVVDFSARPFALMMYGANSKTMRAKDKTTKFAFAGLTDEGDLRAVDLGELDARDMFLNGGYHPPGVDVLASQIANISFAPNHTEGILNVLVEVAASFKAVGLVAPRLNGMPGYHVAEIAGLKDRLPTIEKHWSMLTPLCRAVATKIAEWELERSAAKAKRKAVAA